MNTTPILRPVSNIYSNFLLNHILHNFEIQIVDHDGVRSSLNNVHSILFKLKPHINHSKMGFFADITVFLDMFDLQMMEDISTSLLRDLSQTKQLNNQLTKNNQSLSKTLDDFQKINLELSNKVHVLNQTIKNFETTIMIKNEEVARTETILNAKIDALNQENLALKTNITKRKTVFDSEKDSLLSQITSLTNQLSQNKLKMTLLEKNNARLLKDNQKLKNDVETLMKHQVDFCKLTKSLEQEREKCQTTMKKNLDLIEEVQKQKKELIELHQSVQVLHSKKSSTATQSNDQVLIHLMNNNKSFISNVNNQLSKIIKNQIYAPASAITPFCYICPLSGQPMEDPVIWLEYPVSSFDRKSITPLLTEEQRKRLIPNISLRQSFFLWCIFYQNLKNDNLCHKFVNVDPKTVAAYVAKKIEKTNGPGLLHSVKLSPCNPHPNSPFYGRFLNLKDDDKIPNLNDYDPNTWFKYDFGTQEEADIIKQQSQSKNDEEGLVHLFRQSLNESGNKKKQLTAGIVQKKAENLLQKVGPLLLKTYDSMVQNAFNLYLLTTTSTFYTLISFVNPPQNIQPSIKDSLTHVEYVNLQIEKIIKYLKENKLVQPCENSKIIDDWEENTRMSIKQSIFDDMNQYRNTECILFGCKLPIKIIILFNYDIIFNVSDYKLTSIPM